MNFLELRSQLAKKAQDENMKRITDGAACAAIEEISATWKQLVLDSSPALPTIEVECMKKNEEFSFREVKQSEDDDEVEIILE